ncbi:MAG: bifunctional (p)ppGpp synthetase/guanosine-3',5'-bis(diphosphate) 3'-pyrophosphohydrolase [Oscillospiraceae bacterium]|nr:bifunctional (p)ppGpp synthetase/guanosine-3',5'-bis(diphosphate) 3'-pyrophosphohydrolase [Oscillospiraceae bacterium]
MTTTQSPSSGQPEPSERSWREEYLPIYLPLREKLASAVFADTGRPYFDETDLATFDAAAALAAESHSGQQRDSGEPYIIHPVAVAEILLEYGMDTASITAALLHDVVEDTGVTTQQVTERFGKTVALLVEGVTKLGKLPYAADREELQAENIRKMLLAMSEDIRVMIIKLADRVHNMRTLQYRSEQKRRDVARETLEIYAPIAHRLGIRAFKEELEDLAIQYLDPVGYQEIALSLEQQNSTRSEFLQSVHARVQDRLTGHVSNFQIEGRIKSVHGIYRKMYGQKKSFSEIYDVYAIRVIVDSVADCYYVLGVIHDMFRPIPGRFKDYISTPKPNLYQSLHTTVLGDEAIPFEAQIRTQEMHRTAEYGVAAHWKYKQDITGRSSMEQRLSWIRQLLETQKDAGSVEEIVQTIKSDLAKEEVYALSPKGQVYALPQGATVIDFAYAVHSGVGNKMVGAKVDTRIVPIDYQIKNGEVIEILTTANQEKGPSRDWLKIAATSQAHSKIRSWFKKERREENIAEGRQEVERELRRSFIRLDDEAMEALLRKEAERHQMDSVEEFYAAVGYGGLQLQKFMPRIRDEYQKILKARAERDQDPNRPPEAYVTAARQRSARGEGVVVEGIDNCLVKLSRCCRPLPGDQIIGYITRGFGVSIHTRTCTNVPADPALASEPERWLNAYWSPDVKEEFKASLMVTTINRLGMLADVTRSFANMHVMINSLSLKEHKDGTATVYSTVSVNGLEHLGTVIAKMGKLDGVLRVERA